MQSEKMPEKVSEAITALFARDPDGAESLDEFKARFLYLGFMGCWMGKWNRMDVGIEPDGHTHT